MPQGGIHILIGCHTQHHTYISKECGDNDALHNNQFEDIPRFGTYRLADTKLMGSFLDGDKHDIRDAHDATQQGEESYDP